MEHVGVSSEQRHCRCPRPGAQKGRWRCPRTLNDVWWRCNRGRWIQWVRHPEMGSMLSLVVEDLEATFCRTKPQKLWMKQGNSTHLSCAKDDFRTMGNHSNFVWECQVFNTTPTWSQPLWVSPLPHCHSMSHQCLLLPHVRSISEQVVFSTYRQTYM